MLASAPGAGSVSNGAINLLSSHAESTMPLLRSLRRALPAGSASPRPLVVTADESILDEVLRLAAIAGVDVLVAPDFSMAAQHWSGAPLVLVGPDAAADRVLSRRGAVHLLSTPPHTADVWRLAVGIGAASVLHLPRDEDAVIQELSDATDGSGSATTLAVVGGRGGVGASTLAVALGLSALRRGVTPLVVDLDARGGGLDLVVGAEDAEGLRWDDVGPIEGRLSTRSFVGELPSIHGVSLLSCGRSGVPLPPSTDAVLGAARRAFGVLVLDVPRDGAADVAAVGADCGLVVAAADVRGCAAAHVVACTLQPLVSQVLVVARTGAGRTLSPDDVADAVGFPLVAAIGDDSATAVAYERGEPPSLRRRGPWAAACADILDHVGLLDAAVTAA